MVDTPNLCDCRLLEYHVLRPPDRTRRARTRSRGRGGRRTQPRPPPLAPPGLPDSVKRAGATVDRTRSRYGVRCRSTVVIALQGIPSFVYLLLVTGSKYQRSVRAARTPGSVGRSDSTAHLAPLRPALLIASGGGWARDNHRVSGGCRNKLHCIEVPPSPRLQSSTSNSRLCGAGTLAASARTCRASATKRSR